MSDQNGDKKLSMSLDEIIKMNRQQKKKAHFDGNQKQRVGAGPVHVGSRQQRRPNNIKNRGSGVSGNRVGNRGILNRSRVIRKNIRPNRLVKGAGRMNAIQKNNGFGSRQFKKFGGQQVGNKEKTAYSNQPKLVPATTHERFQQPNKFQNRKIGSGIANKLANRMSGKQIQQPRRAAGVGRRGKPGRVGAIRAGGNKIAMQAARHNVQKAKRLLTTRRQQMQPKQFRNSRAKQVVQNKIRLIRKQTATNNAGKPIGKSINRALNGGSFRQKVQQRQNNQRQQNIRSNRNRGGGFKNRMVLM